MVGFSGFRFAPWGRVILLTVAAAQLTGCPSGNTTNPKESAESPPISMVLPASPPPNPATAPVMVPDSIREKWRAVRLSVLDTKGNVSNQYTVSIGSELVIPNSGLVVKVIAFLPDLKIEGSAFSSASEEPLNPSVHVQILENGREVFNGWLFQLFPKIHSFQHPIYRIILLEGLSST